MCKRQCFILTDDLFFFNGIKDSYPEIEMLRASLAGDFLTHHTPCNISTIIIDGRILLTGQWSGYENLIKTYTNANVVWIFHRSVCGFFSCENFLSCICLHLEPRCFKEKLLERIENQEKTTLPCVRLNANERALLPYFVDGISFEALSKFFSCSEKTLRSHRLIITSKLGFRSALHMSSIFHRVSPLLIDTQQL